MSADTVVPGAGALTSSPRDPTTRAAWQHTRAGTSDPQALNRYSYAHNNPARFTDPTGHCVGVLAGADTIACAVAGYYAATALGATLAYAGGEYLWGPHAAANREAVAQGWGYVTLGWEYLGSSLATSSNNDEVPTTPVGKLTRRDPGYWKRQGIDLEKLKEQLVQGAGGKYDVYTDKEGNVWILRKGESPDKAIYAGHIDDVLDDPDVRLEEQRDGRRPDQRSDDDDSAYDDN